MGGRLCSGVRGGGDRGYRSTHGGSGRSRRESVDDPTRDDRTAADSRIARGVRGDPGADEDRILGSDSVLVRHLQGLGNPISADTRAVVLRAARALPRPTMGLDHGCAEIRDPPRAATDSTDACEAASRGERGFFRRAHARECVRRPAGFSDRNAHRGIHGAPSVRDQWRDRSAHRQPCQRGSARISLRLDKENLDCRSEHPRIEHDGQRSEARRPDRCVTRARRGRSGRPRPRRGLGMLRHRRRSLRPRRLRIAFAGPLKLGPRCKTIGRSLCGMWYLVYQTKATFVDP